MLVHSYHEPILFRALHFLVGDSTRDWTDSNLQSRTAVSGDRSTLSRTRASMTEAFRMPSASASVTALVVSITEKLLDDSSLDVATFGMVVQCGDKGAFTFQQAYRGLKKPWGASWSCLPSFHLRTCRIVVARDRGCSKGVGAWSDGRASGKLRYRCEIRPVLRTGVSCAAVRHGAKPMIIFLQPFVFPYLLYSAHRLARHSRFRPSNPNRPLPSN